MKKEIKIGTRGSKLALWQAHWVQSALRNYYPSVSIDIVIIKTKGDKILDVPLAKVGGKGLFVKEIEESLLNGHTDIAVHSMKDMPADFPEGLCIGAVPKREISNDVLISKNNSPLKSLASNARIGTSSLRRSAQLKHIMPNLEIVPLRGNLDTRLNKLYAEDLDAIVLAAAGVKRLGLESNITEMLDDSVVLPAVGQGALCIEMRQSDTDLLDMIAKLDHSETRKTVLGERSFLKHLGGSCQVPIAAKGTADNSAYVLEGLIASVDGSRVIKEVMTGSLADSELIGTHLADQLLSKGADKILDELEINNYGNTKR